MRRQGTEPLVVALRAEERRGGVIWQARGINRATGRNLRLTVLLAVLRIHRGIRHLCLGYGGPRMAEVVSLEEELADLPEHFGFRQVPTA
jgi:hypothetical protein